jgi:hypothetical protein
VKQSMNCVDDVRVGDSPGTLLINGLCILLGTSSRTLRVRFVRLYNHVNHRTCQ